MIRATLLFSAIVFIPLVGAITAPESKDWRIGQLVVPDLESSSLPWGRFDKLHASVAPSGDRERWAEIPWQTDLAMARREAAREKKPLLMWVMDGHPLGCT